VRRILRVPNHKISFSTRIVGALVFIFLWSICIATRCSAAVIDSTWVSGVGVVDTVTTPNGIDAVIGCCVGDTCHLVPQDTITCFDEVDGRSNFNVRINTQSGGYLVFEYAVETLDTRDFDWLDVFVADSTGDTTYVVRQFGFKGTYTRAYHYTTSKSAFVRLGLWPNQHVVVTFSVMEDQHVDNTRAFIRSIAVGSCPVPPVRLPTDSLSVTMENGNNGENNLSTGTAAALNCFRTKMSQTGHTLSIASGYRTPEYQQHFYDIWNRWQDLKKLPHGPGAPCRDLWDEVNAELDMHGLRNLKTSPAGREGPHTKGDAFDIVWIDGLDFDALVQSCCLYRPLKVKDRVHFVLKGGTCVPSP
jgi:hypothetical protein